MTRLPHDNRNVTPLKGDDYPDYKVGPICAVTGCGKYTDHAHHLWRRSFLAGPYSWVRLWDGTVVGNLVGLCYKHHEEITVNSAKIEWVEQMKGFVWTDQFAVNIPLAHQPPVRSEPASHVTQITVDGTQVHIRDVVHHLPDGEVVGPAAHEKCPTCKRSMPKPKEEKSEEKRPRRTWAITVPVDERENGADVLDGLMEACRDLFGHDESGQVRYFTLAQALALVVQHGDKMVGND